jgi:hypothetical protein
VATQLFFTWHTVAIFIQQSLSPIALPIAFGP